MSLTREVLATVEAILQPMGATAVVPAGPRGLACRIRRSAVHDLADRLQAVGLAPQLVTVADTRSRSGDFTLVYVFAPVTLQATLTVLVSIPSEAPTFASLATRSFAASRFEREIHDLFGVVPVGHPDLRRLALQQFWPEGYYPLRRDVAARGDFTDRGEAFPFRRVTGEGLFEITVGPVHAGIIEPGHFRFTVEGETIVNLETRLGFVHKGTEKLFETLPFERTPALAECVSGDESVGHALAFCQALESLAGCVIPPRAAWLRVVALELERLYNHVGDVGMIVNDTGFSFGHAHCFRLREQLLRLNERVTGHRLLRGTVQPGGVSGGIERADIAEAAADVARILGEFTDIAAACLDNTMVWERLHGTGRLTEATARDMQVVGLVGRASGISSDLRCDAPFAAYGDLDVRRVVYADGDVLARTLVRIDEAREAARLLRRVADECPGGPVRTRLGSLVPHAHALGMSEAWRGPVMYWVLADGPSSLARVKVVDPSFRNWPALEYAVLKNIVPDFPLCNKSFNLSYSGNDL